MRPAEDTPHNLAFVAFHTAFTLYHIARIHTISQNAINANARP
jgi:hypothetical protein